MYQIRYEKKIIAFHIMTLYAWCFTFVFCLAKPIVTTMTTTTAEMIPMTTARTTASKTLLAYHSFTFLSSEIKQSHIIQNVRKFPHIEIKDCRNNVIRNSLPKTQLTSC